MDIKAVYYTEETFPGHLHIVSVCDDQDPRLDSLIEDSAIEQFLLSLLMDKIEVENIPYPHSDVAFFVDGSKRNEVLAQLEIERKPVHKKIEEIHSKVVYTYCVFYVFTSMDEGGRVDLYTGTCDVGIDNREINCIGDIDEMAKVVYDKCFASKNLNGKVILTSAPLFLNVKTVMVE